MQPTLRPGIGNTKHVFTPGGRKKPGSRIKRSWEGARGSRGAPAEGSQPRQLMGHLNRLID